MSEKTRLRRDELKALVLDAGMELLYQDGLGAKTAPIGYVDAFRWLEEHHSISVSRAQVHRRIWDSLDDYRQDVILAIAGYTPGHSYIATVEALESSLKELQLEGTSTEERTTLITNIAADLTDTNAISLKTQGSIAAHDAVSVMYSLGNMDSAETTAVRDAIVDSTRSVMARFVSVYEYIAEVFNAAPGSAWGLDQPEGLAMFSELISCLNHGASGRSTFETSLQEMHIGGRSWSVEGLGAAALASHIAMIDGPRSSAQAGAPSPSHDVPTTIEPGSFAGEPPTGRLDRDTLRSLMIEAGVAVLVEQGFGHGAEQITYSRVFERVQAKHDLSISRAQVHGRIWGSQDDFQLELLRLATLDRMSLHIDAIAERAAEEITRTDLSATDGTRVAMARSIRVGAADTLAVTTGSTPWMLSQAVMAFHALNSDRSDVIGDALHQTYEHDINAWSTMFKTIAEVLDYEPHAWTGLTLDQACVIAARCVDVIADGVVARTRMMGETSTYRLAIAEDEPQEWNLLAIGCWCVVDFLAGPARRDAH